MAEEKAPEGAEGAADGGKKKKLIIIGGAVGGVLVVGAVAFFFLKGGSAEEHSEGGDSHAAGEAGSPPTEGAKPEGEKPAEAAEGHEGDKKGEAKAPAASSTKAGETTDIGATVTLEPFHLNLGNPLENRYLRLEVVLEYRGGEPQKTEIANRMPQLRDAILSVASRKSREFLLGPDGKDQLRRELLIRVNRYMSRPIEAVYITDMLIE